MEIKKPPYRQHSGKAAFKIFPVPTHTPSSTSYNKKNLHGVKPTQLTKPENQRREHRITNQRQHRSAGKSPRRAGVPYHVVREAKFKKGGACMAATVIGRVKSGKGSSYEVKWDQISRDAYVAYAGWTNVGKASSANEAMNKAEAYLYNK
jgi:hypothetical protein